VQRHIQGGGQSGVGFVTNFLESTTVKDLWKSANICQSYERMYSNTVFYSRCILQKLIP